MNLDLSSQQGIVLSACESGRFGEDLPDESIGLPGALVAVGVPQVIGSMWRIPQISAVELTMRICHYRAEGEGIATALRRAQIDTRDSTAVQKRLFFTDAGLEYPGLAPEDERPSTRVYDWAAFALYGVPDIRA
jgi:CHAT domain-containing protein